MGNPGDPRVGVVVLTHERRETCLRTVARMIALPERPRVVVVDNGSRDGTVDAVRERNVVRAEVWRARRLADRARPGGRQV